jgi:hypothetical protein
MKDSVSKRKKKNSVDIPAKEKTTKKWSTKKAQYSPTEDELRAKAEEFYHQRVDRGEYGTAEGDWLAAEEYFRNLHVWVA